MNRARPMAARLKKPRVNHEPRSAHGRAVKKPRVNHEPRSAHGRAVKKNRWEENGRVKSWGREISQGHFFPCCLFTVSLDGLKRKRDYW